ncbi:MAG TPA: BPSS1780 family membrane protein [Methylophilaceae bacterium]
MNTSVLDIRKVDAANGWNWIAEGFALFKKSPVIWIALFFIYLLIGMGLSIVKIVGPIVLNLLAPIFVAGFMMGCRALDNDEELEINHLFAGFKQHAAQLITLGGLYLAGVIIIVGIMFAGTDNTVLHAMFSGEKLSEQQATAALGEGFLFTALLGMFLLVPLIMAYWFAPILIAFHELTPLAAMKQSFNACLRNLMPFFVYSLISMVLLLVAAIPFGLGLLVMIPTMTASLYVSYKDIFAGSLVPAGALVEEQDND